ncbi:MAG: (2Fe-2S) ferredoxin domain-containing protein [Bdellovibrionaceae bacterium]|nr:(2Fe-2S) ferredoxin domain-containing protein [Pseudobdellovibrionaceae bacterium]
MSFKAHLFVCTNSPDKSHKCGSKGAEELRKRLKDRCKNEFGKSVRVSSAGCMGKCEEGIACVIYPQNEWFLNVEDRGRDEDRIFEAVRSAVKNAKD